MGHELWEKAKGIIPGGNGLLSKRPDRYVPGVWPTYYSRAKGVSVWDLDDKHYIDMAQMSMGCAILGYAHDEVDTAVKAAVDSGVCSTLNCPEEVMLAERLLELTPGFGGVRFARTGGGAMAMGVRIARAHAGKSKVAFSGYHGWCDWYLATNLNSDKDGLRDHLLPGLSTAGVVDGLKESAYPFRYNDIDALEKILSTEDIGVIVLEGARYDFPNPDFIVGVNALAKQYNCLLVLDEITSGFRLTDGGVYKLNDFDPDIVVFGKGLGNGYAISAVVGKKDVMDVAQDTFMSSTFWTERVGFAAALKTIEVFTRDKVWLHLSKMGQKIGTGWKAAADRHGVTLTVTDFKPLITMKFGYGDLNDAVATYFSQEMLKRGYLAASSVYVSYAHTDEIIDDYLIAVDDVFKVLADLIASDGLMGALDHGVRIDGFARLT